MLSTSFDLLGSVALVDLEAAAELYGRDTLPYPLGRTRPVGSVWLATRKLQPIEDRLDGSDLQYIRDWVEALVRADICVECRVTYHDEGTPDRRIHVLRSGEFAFAVLQGRSADGVDTINIYTVSPEHLGAAVADSAGLLGPGSRWRITVAGAGEVLPSAPEMLDEYDEFGFPIPHDESSRPAGTPVDISDVIATGTVQSRCEPGVHWGVDPALRTLRWVQIAGDGDYLYEPGDSGLAEPLDASMLASCIDGFIADDMLAVHTSGEAN